MTPLFHCLCSFYCNVLSPSKKPPKTTIYVVGLYHSSHKLASSVGHDPFVRETVIFCFGSENGDLAVHYDCTNSLNGLFLQNLMAAQITWEFSNLKPQQLLRKKKQYISSLPVFPPPRKAFRKTVHPKKNPVKKQQVLPWLRGSSIGPVAFVLPWPATWMKSSLKTQG